ncbi:sucrase ferredoxin [Paenibacillus sp. HJGM_3]|uniref:sucrase ferredoxin n=1 Tax=Paenibacillus sp. HJGM_3 TaxID=3379816 RepID=UPI00385F2480
MLSHGMAGEPKRAMCSLISETVHENLGGTAANVAYYVFVEAGVPWADDALESRHVPAGLKERLKQLSAKGHSCKTLIFTSDTNRSPAGTHRVLLYRKPAAPLVQFDKQEYVVPAEQVGDLIQAYIERRSMEEFQPYEQMTGHVRDLFVCTHGSHDACCGKFGYGAYRELERYAGQSGGELRAWRVSHIGGHRFAPTAIDLPEGRYWGRLTAGAIEAIVSRQEPAAEVLRFVRGWGAMNTAEQLVEREIFAKEGWAWTTYLRSAESEGLEDGSTRVHIKYRTADGSVSGAYTAVVRETASIEVYGCEYEAPRAYPQYNVEAFSKST